MGSGGGAGSGQIGYPAYLEGVHEDFLKSTGSFPAGATSIFNLAVTGNSPFFGMAGHDPATQITAMGTALTNYENFIDAVDPATDWAAYLTAIIAAVDADIYSTAKVDAHIAAFGDVMDDEVTTTLIRFQAGMSDINAVQSTAFTIGQAIIEGMKNRDVAKYGADLHAKAYLHKSDAAIKSADTMLQILMSTIEAEKSLAHYLVEVSRISIVALKEQIDQDLHIDEADGRWDLEAISYMAHALGCLGGASHIPPKEQRNPVSSAIGGALSGAGIGAAIPGAGVPGALIGGVVGAIGGLLT